MKSGELKLLLTSSPFLKQEEDTPYIMRQVIIALLPATLAALYFFGINAFLVILVSILGAMFTEWLFTRSKGVNTLHDGSAALTGLLLALVLPPGIPLWMAFLGGVVSIGIGKMIFGGLGSNIFNPALVGRAFLQAAFPVAMTTWSPVIPMNQFFHLYHTTLGIPFLKMPTAVTTATPLARMKFDAQLTAFHDLFLGSTAGSLGETSSLLILLGGIYMVLKKVINWRIPLAIFISMYVFAGILHWINPGHYAPPTFHLFAGGIMLGAIFMATDPVTSPVTQKGCWVFGIGIGFLVILIRTFGGLPEGVMYAILLMNAFTPLINRVTRERVYGTE
ncbi:MAG: RnfABCDGE type electron transport complex subunit D [Calditrichaeota bacterium]|nr:MAG: RnfABCDGE type electron transport complex subunit D [Calditrichota bacterium]